MSYIHYRTSKTKSSAKITSLENFCKNYKGKVIISYARVSRYYKDWRRYLSQQHDTVEKEMSCYGVEIYKKFNDVSPGYHIERRQLQKVVTLSRKTKYPVIVQDIDRLLRHKDFHAVKNPTAKPTKKQMERFLSYYHDVTFVIMDTTEAIKKNKTMRGQSYKKNKGGRPKSRKQRKRELQSIAIQMREEKHSLRKIAGELNVSAQTIWNWCNEDGGK